MWAADEGDVSRSWQVNIVGKQRLPGQESRVFIPFNSFAKELSRHKFSIFHAQQPGSLGAFL